jgi:hypothetical protein
MIFSSKLQGTSSNFAMTAILLRCRVHFDFGIETTEIQSSGFYKIQYYKA